MHRVFAVYDRLMKLDPTRRRRALARLPPDFRDMPSKLEETQRMFNAVFKVKAKEVIMWTGVVHRVLKRLVQRPGSAAGPDSG